MQKFLRWNILFDWDAALMPVPQKPGEFAPDEAAVLHHSDLESALSRVSHSTSDEDLQISAEWMELYGARWRTTLCERFLYTLSVNVYIEQDRHMWRYQNMWTLWHCSQEATRHISRFSCVSDIFTLCCCMNISVKDRNKRLTEKTITPSCGPLSFLPCTKCRYTMCIPFCLPARLMGCFRDIC